jgi:membrane fusion protein, multidrug efflux system
MILLLVMKRYRWLILIVVIAGIYLYSHRLTLFNFGKASPAIPVTVAPAIKKDVTVTYTTIGQTQTIASVNVTAQVSGQLVAVNFKEGDLVHAGDVLFQIDSRPYEAQLSQAEANLAKDSAQLVSNKLLLGRYQPLLKKGFVTKQDYDQTKANEASGEATVKADEAAVSEAKINLDYCTIKAPITGRTGNLLMTQGNNVTANDNTTLVTINQLQPIYVSFALPDKMLSVVRQEMQDRPIVVKARTTNSIETGIVTFINNAIDNTTGTIQLKATFANDKEKLWPGQFTNITVPTQTLKQAIVVPADAVQQGQNGAYVYLLKTNNTVAYQVVNVGPIVENGIVITKGLNVGDKVITAGQLRLDDGSKVIVETEK